MNIHELIQQRQALLRKTQLANAAYVYQELGRFAARIARARLRGRVTLIFADPDGRPGWPALVADEGSQSVIDEHFTDRDVFDLADLLLYATGSESRAFLTFRIEELDRRFRPGLRRELELAGVEANDERQESAR